MIKLQLVACVLLSLALTSCTKKEGASGGSNSNADASNSNTILVGEYGSMTGWRSDLRAQH